MIHRLLISIGGIVLTTSMLNAHIITIDGRVKTVDVAKRTITIESGAKERTLDVSSKAKIIVDDNDESLESLAVGQKVSLGYHGQLEVVVRIQAKSSEILANLKELNGPSNDIAPWVSSDGLRIYWTAEDEKVRERYCIYTALRDSPRSPFKKKKRLFEGHGGVLSKDELELYFRSPEGDFISLSTRNAVSEEFGPPIPVRTLTFVRLDPAPRWLTDDGLMMYLDMKDPQENNRHFTWEVKRNSINADWESPHRTRIEAPDMPHDFRFTQVSASPDNLHILCGSEGTKDGNLLFRVGILSRSTTDQPFIRWRELNLETPKGYPICLKPQFVPQTNELYLVSPFLHETDQAREALKADLWVIKGFSSPF